MEKEIVVENITSLNKKLGRTPSRRDTIKFFGDSIANAARRHFGTWNKCIEYCGLVPNASGCSDKWRK